MAINTRQVTVIDVVTESDVEFQQVGDIVGVFGEKQALELLEEYGDIAFDKFMTHTTRMQETMVKAKRKKDAERN